tara:strand:- start:54067 stop:54450 length:384 start_codon:yes stop_codon:yes gene_type:complete
VEPASDGEDDDQFKQLLSVSLRPDDPFAKRLLSTAVTTNNLLLKVTVPKRTGRKRKRGSEGPFWRPEETGASEHGVSNGSHASPQHTYADASTIYQSLQDNASTYKVALAGVLDETHRFRSKYCHTG